MQQLEQRQQLLPIAAAEGDVGVVAKLLAVEHHQVVVQPVQGVVGADLFAAVDFQRKFGDVVADVVAGDGGIDGGGLCAAVGERRAELADRFGVLDEVDPSGIGAVVAGAVRVGVEQDVVDLLRGGDVEVVQRGDGRDVSFPIPGKVVDDGLLARLGDLIGNVAGRVGGGADGAGQGQQHQQGTEQCKPFFLHQRCP